MKTYVVRIACEVAGAWRKPGVPFPLTEDQARPISPPHGRVVYPYMSAVAAPKPEPTNDRQYRHPRRKRRAT